MFWNPANFITLVRILLLPIFAVFLFSGNASLLLLAFFLCPLIFFLDYVDGWVARKFGFATSAGEMMDITADRITEAVMWILFAMLNIIPLWAALIIILRGIGTDIIRTRAKQKGKSVYKIARTDIGKFLVNSRIMRGLNALTKIILFTACTTLIAFNYQQVQPFIFPLAVLAVSINLARGMPIFIEGRKLF